MHDTRRVQIIQGDCREVLKSIGPESIDAIVTDPPYGLEFMGKEWDSIADYQSWCASWAKEALRVLKPGGYLLSFGGTRTYHRLISGIEDAGFEIRDTICWLYGSGFPKSLDVSKAMDKAAGMEREIIEQGPTVRRLRPGADQNKSGSWEKLTDRTFTHTQSDPATEEGKRWEGWGTALKPAYEPIVVSRKPLIGTVVANVLEHGTGALNIDGCRIETSDKLGGGAEHNPPPKGEGWDRPWRHDADAVAAHSERIRSNVQKAEALGRWPANVILDEEAASLLDEQTGILSSGANPTRRGSPKLRNAYGEFQGQEECEPARGIDAGGASRFFYCAKASRSERGEGNDHPTVKPLSLMRWLVRLVTPPTGTVLDPFMGSGTTIRAAISEGFDAIGIEIDSAYVALAETRINGVQVTLPMDGESA